MTSPTQRFTAKAFALALAASLTLTGNAAELTPVRGDSDAARKGFEIAARSDRTDRGFGDSIVQLKMVLTDAAGNRDERDLEITTLEIPDESVGDKSLVLFGSPKNVKGTALLSHAKILDPDDQWLLLPRSKRVKQIATTNKSGPFVGSEFAYEDFSSLELNKYDYEYIGEEPCGTFTCDIVDRFPRYEYSGYTRQRSWVDQSVYQVRKVEFFDRRGDLLKTLTLSDYREYDGGIWRAHTFTMENHRTGKRTELLYDDYEFKVGLTDRAFDRGELENLR